MASARSACSRSRSGRDRRAGPSGGCVRSSASGSPGARSVRGRLFARSEYSPSASEADESRSVKLLTALARAWSSSASGVACAVPITPMSAADIASTTASRAKFRRRFPCTVHGDIELRPLLIRDVFSGLGPRRGRSPYEPQRLVLPNSQVFPPAGYRARPGCRESRTYNRGGNVSSPFVNSFFNTFLK